MKMISSKCLPSRAMLCSSCNLKLRIAEICNSTPNGYSLWRGRSWCYRGFASANYRKFCLFTKPDKWKWASSLQSRGPGGTFANILSQAACLSCLSRSWSFWTINILYGWNFKSRCKILRTLRSETPKASASLAAERCGDVVTAWSLVSIRYQEISVLILKRSVGNCVCTILWFFCLALFRAGLCQNEWETGAEQQSRNHHIWNGSPPQTHDDQ